MTLVTFLYAHAVALFILLAALGLGDGVMRLLHLPTRAVERLWLAAVCGLGTLSVGTLLLGMLGLFYSVLFAVLLTPCALAGSVLLVRSGLLGAMQRWLTWRDGEIFRIVVYLLLTLSAGSALWIWLTHALMPPHEWDEIAYHLTLAKLYVNAHHIMYVPFIVHSNWPMNSEMLFCVALLFGSDIAPHLLMLATALLSAFGLLVIAHHFFDDRVGAVAVALFLTVPLVERLAGTGLIDITAGVYVLAALLAFDRWQAERRRSWLALCGVLCGFAAGSKLMGGGFPLLFGLLVVLVELRRRPVRIHAVLAQGALFGLAGILVAGPWYARSWLFTGNPIWPFAYSVLGGRNWDALGDEYHTGSLLGLWSLQIPLTPLGLVQSFVYLITRPSDMGGYRGAIGTVLPLGTLCAAMFAWNAPRLLRQALFVCAGFYLLWFFLVSNQARFLLPIVPLLALATGYAFVWIYDRIRLRAMRLALLAILLLLIVREWPWADAGERALLTARTPYLRGEITREAWLDTQIDSLPVFRYANTYLPSNAVLLLLPYENRTYYLDRLYIWGHPISQRIIRFEQFDNVTSLMATLQRMGITHVIDDPIWIYEGTRYWQHDRALMLALRDQCGQPLYRQGETVLYKLTACATHTRTIALTRN